MHRRSPEGGGRSAVGDIFYVSTTDGTTWSNPSPVASTNSDSFDVRSAIAIAP